MAPDHIADMALLSVSCWQRRAYMNFRRDMFDTIETCFEDGSSLEDYILGDAPPHYTLPVKSCEADMAANHWWLNGNCPAIGGPCLGCIKLFISEIEYLHLRQRNSQQ